MAVQLSLFDERQSTMMVANANANTWRENLCNCAVLDTEEASRLARLSRGRVMAELRVTHRWTLQAIADLVGLSRERVRQITPPIEGDGINPFNGNGGKAQAPRPINDRDKERVLQLAARTPGAWHVGRLSKVWVARQLGYEPDTSWNFRTTSKLLIIFRYGLGLTNRTQMHQWITEMYYEKGMSYASITRWLSQRFVPIALMTVHRFFTRELGFEGCGVGRRVTKKTSIES